ncbi:hypothetical protein OG21DRAFT_1516754 [Imleria badia]|nr:hypothetical protein OG21DRAFT_1516754 [Imleria badia]
MDAGDRVISIAVPRDGRWVVSGSGKSGRVTVWDAESREKVIEFKAHTNFVGAVDISPDGTRIATGSDDKTACVWSFSTGQRLLGPLKHSDWVIAAKFSPDGHLLATATWRVHSVRIYDSRTGHLLFDFSVKVSSSVNQSIAWVSDSKQLFALYEDANIVHLDVTTETTLSQWRIQSEDKPRGLALACNGTFIAASTETSVSFWDTTTHKQIGSVIEHTPSTVSMAISANNDIVIGGNKIITIRNLCNILPSHYFDNTFREREIWRMKVEKVDLEEKIESLRAQDKSSNGEIASLKETIQQLRNQLSDTQKKADNLDHILRLHERKHQCEVLYAQGRMYDSVELLLEITSTITDEVRANKLIIEWLSGFTRQCITTLEKIGDEASNLGKADETLKAYSAALSLGHSTPNAILIKWVSTALIRGSTNEVLGAATKFKLPGLDVYRVICDVLEGSDRVTEAIMYYRLMRSELEMDTSDDDEWEPGFRRRCTEKLGRLGDIAMDTKNYNETAENFSTILSLDPVNRTEILIKRSKAWMSMNSWDKALSDADEAIKLEPSCHRGYEMRHSALHGAGRYAEAVEAFNKMILKLEESPDKHIRELRRKYADPRSTIRRVVNETIRHMPRVLIDTTTGHLYDKKHQAEAFEALPIYNELLSSMTTKLDDPRIRREVKGFYQYVMFSHKWEYDEPLLQKVEKISIYELEESPANIKLQRFCSLVRSLGFHWAWSDTCCVDKVNNVVLQESLVAMFTWYRGSSLTVVYLRGVSSESQLPGGLQGSIWNTRAWTYQEYVAAETVQFYTEDWKPYLGLTLPNHKDSPVIISEMQQATGVTALELSVLRPGLDRVREKLYLASTRQTTLVEDIAYSLLGIFNVAIPVIYGEGDRAVGRLLEHILTGSGDVTILAWTRRAGSYNSCLPVDLTVYDQLAPPHVPQPIEETEMDRMVMELRSTSPDLSLVTTLCKRLHDLPPPFLAASRLRLAGIVFPLTDLVSASEATSESGLDVYLGSTSALGDVEIQTRDPLLEMQGLLLVFPWISPLLDQAFSHGSGSGSSVSGQDETERALRLVVGLRQPFGALLLAPLSRVQYRRVSTDSLIVVRVREGTELTELIEGVRTIDVQ